MPVVSYPSSCVWYIEGRRWKSGDGKLANAGSGVVVALEHLDKDGAPFAKPQIKRYLLTCGHVVREHATGPLLDEFLCWEPTRGYSRLDQRKRGEAAVVGASLATVCPLSPCGAQQDAAPSTLPSDDWVLLEVKSDAFQAQSAVQRWAEGEGEAPLTVVGYPGGAGVEGQQGWPNGHIVVPRDSLEFRHARSAPAPGMYNYEGPEDTRAGMSGGGVFDRMHRLVAIHRSATDAAMQRSAVSATHIRNWLLNRGYRPALFPEWNPTPEAQRDQQPVLAPSAPPSRPPPIGWPTLGWLAAAAAGVLWAYLWLAPNIVELHITLRKQTESGGVGPLVHGARLSFSPKDFSSKEIEPGATDAQGKAIIKIRAPGNRFDTPPMSGYIVVVAPPPESDLSAQYAVRPHGMLERKQGQLVETYRDPEALDIRAQTHASVYLVKGEDWVVRTLTHGLQGSDTGLQTQIAQAMARARLSPESSREATDLWVTVLKGSRPVLPEAALSSRYDRTQRPQVERIIRSVGQVTGQGSPGVVSTGFMIGKGQLLVPLYALSTDGRGRVSFSGDSPSRDQPVLPFRRILWRSEKLKLALVELEGDAPEPLSVERSTPSVDLAGRKAFVVGYPQVTDGRIPAELKEVFAAASGRRAVMPGQLLTTRSRSEIAHDATTAGGVSGGPIVDEHSGLVLGIHQMGQWKGQNKENSGVPTWALFEDPAFVAALKDGG